MSPFTLLIGTSLANPVQYSKGCETGSYHFESGTWVPRSVQERHDNLYNGPLVTITTDGGPIRTTLYHPFWVVEGYDLEERPAPRELSEHEDEGQSLEGRWVNSHDLQAGDLLIGTDGRLQRVLKIAQEYQELFPVSNLTIDEDHTFAVGPDAILVHNTSACPFADAPGGFSNLELGQEMHEKFGKELTERTGTTLDHWELRTGKGQTGIDATYQGPQSRYPGFDHAELKPRSQHGWAIFGQQLANWVGSGHIGSGDSVALWMYNQVGEFTLEAIF